MRVLNRDKKVVYVLFSVIMAYFIAILMLLAISFLMMKAGIGSGLVSVLIALTYIIPPFIAGMYMGRHAGTKRFMWGGISAAAFLIVYLILVAIMGAEEGKTLFSYLGRAALILASGVLGGMLS